MVSPDAKRVFGIVTSTLILASCAPAESQGQNNQQEFTTASINALLTEYSKFDVALPNGKLQGAELQDIAVQETKDTPDVLQLTSENGESFTASVATATLVTKKGESTDVLVLVRHENKDILVLRSEPHPSIDTDGIAHSDGKIAVLKKDKKQLTESASSSFEASFDTTSDTGVIWLTIGKTMFTLSDESEENVMTKVVALLTQPDDVSAEEPTPTSAAPKVELTATEDPLSDAPEGTTGFDKKTGEPIREVTYENKKKVEFHLNEQGEWVSLRGEFPLIDNGPWEYVNYRIYAKDSVLSDKFIPEFLHPDSIEDNNRPITSRIKAMFLDRLGLSPDDPEYYRLINEEMDKGQESEAILPIITSDGIKTFVRLSNANSINLIISDATTLEELFKKKEAIKWNDETGAVFYLSVTVDENNNAICTASSTKDMETLSKTQLRNFLFSCVSHIFSQEDQRASFNFSNTQVLANVSATTIKGTTESDLIIKFP